MTKIDSFLSSLSSLSRKRYRCAGCKKRISTENDMSHFFCSKCGSAKAYPSFERVCRCDGYHFPHRKGSKWCIHSAVKLTEDDFRERSAYSR